jgi:hypothetical protein
MNAIYPAAVRTYPVKLDQVTTVDASDVNDLQDEMGAVQRTVGVNPLRYLPTGEPTVTYPSVAKRLDSHEGTLAALQNEINVLSFAASNGWDTPVLRVSQGGVTPPLLTVANPANFGAVVWNTPPVQDPGDMWTAGTSIVCVLGGWYQIEVTWTGAIDTTALTAAQNANNVLGIVPVPIAYQRVLARLTVNGAVAKAHPVAEPWAPFYIFGHFLNFTWSGPLHQGDVLGVQLGQYNGSASGTATFAATYVRALPGVS